MITTRSNRRFTTVVAIVSPPPKKMMLLAMGAAMVWACLAAPLLSRTAAGWRISLPWSAQHDAGPVASAASAEAVLALSAAARREAADRLMILQMVSDYRARSSSPQRQELADAIYRESVAADVDPFLVASIVARESSFRSRAVSRVGAVGLMQLRPFVAKNVAQRSSIEWNGVETLHSPDRNLRLGILYYKELLDRFEGDREMALTAYNYGPTRVSAQVARGTYRGSSYANKIINLYDSLKLERAG